MSGKIRTYLELIRYGNCLMAGFAALIGLAIAFNILSGANPEVSGFKESPAASSVLLNSFSILEAALVFLVVFLVSGAGNAINDYFDVEIDAINRPERPIPSGRVGTKEALSFSLFLFSLASALGFLINPICGFIALFNSLLLIFYAKTLKSTPFFGNLSIGYLTGSTFLFGASIFGFKGLKALAILFLLAALATTAREIIKDIEDMEGDKREGADTLPLRIGARKAGFFAGFIGFLAVLLSPLPYLMEVLGSRFLYLVSFADLVFFAAIFQLLAKKNPTKASKLFKLAMLLSLISFLAGA